MIALYGLMAVLVLIATVGATAVALRVVLSVTPKWEPPVPRRRDTVALIRIALGVEEHDAADAALQAVARLLGEMENTRIALGMSNWDRAHRDLPEQVHDYHSRLCRALGRQDSDSLSWMRLFQDTAATFRTAQQRLAHIEENRRLRADLDRIASLPPGNLGVPVVWKNGRVTMLPAGMIGWSDLSGWPQVADVRLADFAPDDLMVARGLAPRSPEFWFERRSLRLHRVTYDTAVDDKIRRATMHSRPEAYGASPRSTTIPDMLRMATIHRANAVFFAEEGADLSVGQYLAISLTHAAMQPHFTREALIP